MDIYREEILDHYKNPRNFGPTSLKASRGEVRLWAMDRNASCGDVIEIGLLVSKGIVKDIKFSGVGCAVSMAAASMLTELVKGKRLLEVKKLTEKDVYKKLGIKISLGRQKCAQLGLVTLKKAIN